MCGMRKSYAQALMKHAPAGSAPADTERQHAPMTTPSPAAKVSEQIAAVARMLMSTSAARNQQPSAAPLQAPPQADPVPSAGLNTSQTKAQIQTSIKQLEAAAAQLHGDEFADARSQMMQQIENKRKLIIDSKPIGQRIDNSREALSRARKRFSQAQEAAALARAAVSSAAEEEAKLQQELIDLEASVATGTPPPPLLEALEQQLLAAVEALGQLGSIHPCAVAEAREQAQILLSKFKCTMSAAANVDTDTPSKRLEGKQPPTPTSTAATRRLNGKQAPKRRSPSSSLASRRCE